MPGPLPGQTVTAGTIFGLSQYGTSLYGLGLPPEYLVEPMTAASDSYTSVLVTWHPPSGIIFRYRLLRNRFGFPVNENDGDIIYDTTGYPGDSYTDLDVSPGTYHYYGFYVLIDIADNIWVRSGFAGCLAIENFGSGAYLFNLLPEYFITIPETGAALTDDAAGNNQLQLFLNIFGWALDYLRTQYAAYANHLNDARFIPLDQLWDLANQVGLTFSPETPAYTVRKATENFAHVAQQRGTLQGITEEIAIRTGYGADVHMGPNILLDDDQGQILNPIFLQYQPARCYAKDECVWVPFAAFTGGGWKYYSEGRGWTGDGWWFRSLQSENCGNTPPAGGTSNSFWGALYDSDDFLGTQGNIKTSSPSTWEVLDTGATNFLALPGSATQGLGVTAPPPVSANSSSFAWNALRFYNKQGSARTLQVRSVSRTHADLGQIPDPSFELGTTLAAPVQATTAAWVPQSWPGVTTPNWMGGQQQVSVPAYWTPVNAVLSREDAVAHTGSWAMQVTPAGAATPVAVPSAVQYPNPGFENPSLTGWTAVNCTITQATAQARGGKFSLQVSPDFTIGTTYSGGFAAGTSYTLAGNPYVTGPQVTAIPGTADTVTAYCWGTKTPAGASAFPSVIAAIIYYDLNGNVLGTTEGTSTLLSAAWTAVTATATAPAGAASKALMITSDPAQTANADDWFTDDIAWAWNAAGSWSAVTLNSPWVACPAGTACTASAYYQAAAAGSSVQAQVIFYDSGGNTLAAGSGSLLTGTANTWVNPSASGTAPSGTAYAALQLVITSPVTVSYVDDAAFATGLTYSTAPDPLDAVRDGIPVPWVINGTEWDPSVRYVTGDLVQYRGQPFTALRASAGSVPPPNNVATADWAPLSQSHRIRLCLSGYTSQNLTSGAANAYAVTPFIEWYDQQGNFITRVFARNPDNNGTVLQPNNMAFDSFTTESILSSAGTGAGTATLTPWNASYYNNISLSGAPAVTRAEPAVNYAWNGTAPAPGVALSGWSASWTATYTAPGAGSYGFQLQAADGGSRLIVNGQTLIDNWASQSAANLTAAVTLAAGQVITVETDYWTPAQPDSASNTVSVSGQVSARYEKSTTFANEWILNFNGILSSAIVPASPGQVATISADGAFFAGVSSGHLYASVNWIGVNGQTVIAADTLEGATGVSGTFTAPDGTTAAQLIVAGAFPSPVFAATAPSVSGTASGTMTVGALPPGATDGLVFGTVTTPAIPASATQFSNTIAGRATDDTQSNWTCPVSDWTIGGYAGGSAWPAVPGAQAIALLATQPANTSLGVTYRSMPQGGGYAGIVFRYSSTSNYWRSDQLGLGYVSSGVYTLAAAHAQAFQVNDRMTITLNNNAITVYRNGVQVNSATSSFNNTAAEHGLINDILGSSEAKAGDSQRKHGVKSRTKMPPQRPGRPGKPGRAGRT